MADLHVSKQSISKLFKEMQNRKFIGSDIKLGDGVKIKG